MEFGTPEKKIEKVKISEVEKVAARMEKNGNLALTLEEKRARQRRYNQKRRNTMSNEALNEQRKKQRERNRQRRAEMTEDERAEYRERQRVQQRERWEAMTPEEREAKRQEKRAYQQERNEKIRLALQLLQEQEQGQNGSDKRE